MIPVERRVSITLKPLNLKASNIIFSYRISCCSYQGPRCRVDRQHGGGAIDGGVRIKAAVVDISRCTNTLVVSFSFATYHTPFRDVLFSALDHHTYWPFPYLDCFPRAFSTLDFSYHTANPTFSSYYHSQVYYLSRQISPSIDSDGSSCRQQSCSDTTCVHFNYDVLSCLSFIGSFDPSITQII